MQREVFRLILSGVDRIHDEARHPAFATLSRRAFAKLIGGVAALAATRSAWAMLPFGECDQCGARGCHSECATRPGPCERHCIPPAVCHDNHCWCTQSGDTWKLTCDCRCDGNDCECTLNDARQICGSNSPGKIPGDLF